MDDTRGVDLTGIGLPIRSCFDIPKEGAKGPFDVIISALTITNWRYERC